MLFGITYTSQFSVGNILSPWDDFKSLLICLLLLHLVPQVSYPYYDIHKWCFLKPLASFTLLLESSHRVVDFSSDLVGQSDSTLFHSLKCDPNFYVFLRKPIPFISNPNWWTPVDFSQSACSNWYKEHVPVWENETEEGIHWILKGKQHSTLPRENWVRFFKKIFSWVWIKKYKISRNTNSYHMQKKELQLHWLHYKPLEESTEWGEQ